MTAAYVQGESLKAVVPLVDTLWMLTSGLVPCPCQKGGGVYGINPFAPVDDIAEDLLRRADQHKAGMDLARSFATAVKEGSSEAMLRLSLAHYVWRNDRLDAETMAEIVAVMMWQGVKKSKSG